MDRLITSSQHVHRRVRQIDSTGHQATRSERASSVSRDRSRPPPYPKDSSEPEKSIGTLSKASTIRAASIRSACIRNASLIVATFVPVPRTCRAASSHSSFTSTVMRAIETSIHQDRIYEYTKHTASQSPSGLDCRHHSRVDPVPLGK